MRKLLIIAVFFCLACHKDNSTYVPPSIVTRTVSGTVSLYDQFGNLQNNYSGVTIYLNGISNTVIANTTLTLYPSNDTIVTDGTGKYVFYDVNEGNYNITYVKSGYDTIKVINYPIKGSAASAALPAVGMVVNSSTIVSSISAVAKGDSTSDTITVSGIIDTVSIAGKTRDVIVFVDTIANVSSTSYVYAKPYITVYTTAPGNTFSVNIFPNNFGYTSGSKLYIVAYGISFAPVSAYRNPTTGLLVYPGLSSTPSNIVSVTLP